MNLLIVSSENGSLTGGKVGGIGDVIRDIPCEIARQEATVHVITPSYGFLHRHEGARWVQSVTVDFYAYPHQVELYEVPAKRPCPGVTHWILDHPLFVNYDGARNIYRIYTDDPPDRPFAGDATKFALFSLAVAEVIRTQVFGPPDCLHMHDWHAAFLLILRRFHPTCDFLQHIRTVYTIHNLALQGIRPFKNNVSSLEAWYPHMAYQENELADPRWPDCLNLMAVGIRLADAVHTVSPSYAEEILLPSDKPRYYGGEGLENDLKTASASERFFGILNGCTYPPHYQQPAEHVSLFAILKKTALEWSASSGKMVPARHFLAYARLTELELKKQKPPFMLTSITRVVEQKLYLMQASGSNGISGLENILKILENQGIYILLGTGDEQYEEFLTRMSARHDHFIFLNGYSEACADALYAGGDMFLMPSSFEPCGISQMLAMRAGQPCLVHHIGGLKDTVQEESNGFAFRGDSVEMQVDAMCQTLENAIDIKRHRPKQWLKIRRNAADARFSWEKTVQLYMEKLYQSSGSGRRL
jgi:starch synthase